MTLTILRYILACVELRYACSIKLPQVELYTTAVGTWCTSPTSPRWGGFRSLSPIKGELSSSPLRAMNASTMRPRTSGVVEMVASRTQRMSYFARANGSIRLLTFGLTPTFAVSCVSAYSPSFASLPPLFSILLSTSFPPYLHSTPS